MNRSYLISRDAVEVAYLQLPPIVHTDDPRTLYSRILAGTFAGTHYYPSYEFATHQAALWLALVVAVDRAELGSVTSGCDGVSCSPGEGGCGCGEAA